MKLARIKTDQGRLDIVRVDGEALTSLSKGVPGLPDCMMALIEQWDNYRDQIAALPESADYQADQVTFLAPIERPGKIFAIGLNYADHIAESEVIAESKIDAPEHQTWFAKASTSVTGPFDPIERPIVSEALDYEAELVLVVGKRCKHVRPENVDEVVFGYCIGNDVSVRDWQMQTPQFTLGKSFDTSAPIGPWITTADEVDPSNLDIKLTVNGETQQSSNTRHMIFDCTAQLVHLSKAMTLEPGDLIFTGTPEGVGAAQKPPLWLKPGDRVRVEIEGLGAIDNSVVDEVNG